MSLLDQIQVNHLRRIFTNGGDVMHALKSTEDSFKGFGEAYFSWVEPGAIKAWKMHQQMTMNLIVPIGEVKFVFHDSANSFFREERIGAQNYQRLTVPPGIWFGFQVYTQTSSLVLNLASIPHDPTEVEHKELEEIQFNWR